MSAKTIILLQSITSSGGSASSTSISNDGVLEHGISRTNNFLQLIGLVFMLILVLVAAYFTTRFIARYSSNQFKNSNFQVIDTYRISPNKLIQIIKIGNKYVVIAVGKDNVNFITELDESEIFIRDQYAKENMSFKQILDKIRNKSE